MNKEQNKESLVENYERRLKQLPQQDKQIIEQIRKYQDMISDQNLQLNQQNLKIKTYQSQLIKLQKVLQQRQNQINQLNQSEQKNTIANLNSESKKVLSTLTKGQIKINTLNQTLNDLKLKLMQQHTNSKKDNVQDDNKKDQKIINELFTAIKKQLALIDILKRQKVHVVASTVFKYCEEQFENVLEMNGKK